MTIARFKVWILAPMTIAVLLGLVCWWVFLNHQAMVEARKAMARLLEQSRNYRQQVLSEKIDLLRAHAGHLARDPQLIGAWRHRDREALFAHTAPIAALLRDFSITHFYLVEPDRTVFLRPYNPGKIGGMIERHTMLEAAAGRPGHGLEMGSSGTLTLRYVIPWQQQGELLGFIELGMETDFLLQEISAALQVEIVSVIRKKFTSRENFAAGRGKFGFSGHWDDFPDLVVAHQSLADLPAGLRSWLAGGHEPHAGPIKFFSHHQGRLWWSGIIHQKDAAGRDVADLVILYDVSDLMATFRRCTCGHLGLAGLIFGALLILLRTSTRWAERKVDRALEEVRHQATHDQLTGLPNRELFVDRLHQMLNRAAREEQALAVLHLDLDNFKAVNNSYGQASGDMILRLIARRLQESLRSDDTVARFGGDEFIILLSELQDCRQGGGVARKILAIFENPITADNLPPIHIGASLGISCFPDDGRDGEVLIPQAEMAMYQAKRAGRGCYAFFDEELNSSVQDDLLIHSRLKAALAAGRLELHYQPQVTVNNGRISGVEALLRWQDDELGSVSPARFIPVAEASGLIIPLGEWVLNTACRQLAAWHQAGFKLRIAVNLSPHQFRQPELVGYLSSMLAATGAPTTLLELEITETAAMADIGTSSSQLMALSNLGVSIALDDFGTGHSCLAYLNILPLDTIKIDRGFIRDLALEESKRIIIPAVLGMARHLGLQVVAEGVETEEQLAFIREHGCDTYQGWLFARALPAGQLEEMLNRYGGHQ